MAAVKAPAGAGAVEVTYRFDDQPAVREQWAYAEGVSELLTRYGTGSRRLAGWCSALAVTRQRLSD